MENHFSFADEELWGNERLRDYGKYLGEHILIAATSSPRYTQMYREINHIIFELNARHLADVPRVDV